MSNTTKRYTYENGKTTEGKGLPFSQYGTFKWNIPRGSRWNCQQDMRAYWDGYSRIDWSKKKTGSVDEQQAKAQRQEGGCSGCEGNARSYAPDTRSIADGSSVKEYPNL